MRIAGSSQTRWLVALFVLALGDLVASPTLFAGATIAVPAPTGVYKVGTTVVRLVGSDDPYLTNHKPRELIVRFWYPTYIRQGCRQAPYTDTKVWNYVSEI